LATVATADADELVMFQQAGCPYCAAWNHDVGGIYAKTDEAQVLPLRRVDIHAPRPADLRAIAGIHFTPTFVVMHCGHEAARLTGYTGDANFWGLLDREIEAIKTQPPCAS
jgi:thioredoxin-related protein